GDRCVFAPRLPLYRQEELVLLRRDAFSARPLLAEAEKASQGAAEGEERFVVALTQTVGLIGQRSRDPSAGCGWEGCSCNVRGTRRLCLLATARDVGGSNFSSASRGYNTVTAARPNRDGCWGI